MCLYVDVQVFPRLAPQNYSVGTARQKSEPWYLQVFQKGRTLPTHPHTTESDKVAESTRWAANKAKLSLNSLAFLSTSTGEWRRSSAGPQHPSGALAQESRHSCGGGAPTRSQPKWPQSKVLGHPPGGRGSCAHLVGSAAIHGRTQRPSASSCSSSSRAAAPRRRSPRPALPFLGSPAAPGTSRPTCDVTVERTFPPGHDPL